jgi:F-type H+-transporting ATPase subunit epsilon
VLFTESAVQVHLNTVAGSYGILPRHADFATALVSGIFEYRAVGGEAHFVAADSGTAVKQGNEVVIATPYAVTSTNLHELEVGVREHFTTTDARERELLEAMQRLEASLTHGVWELARKERSA